MRDKVLEQGSSDNLASTEKDSDLGNNNIASSSDIPSVQEAIRTEVYNTLQSTFAKSELSPKNLSDLLRSETLVTPFLDRGAALNDSAVQKAIYYIHDAYPETGGKDPYFKLDSRPGVLASNETFTGTFADIQSSALNFISGAVRAKGYEPEAAATLERSIRDDLSQAYPLTPDELGVLKQIRLEAQGVAARGLELRGLDSSKSALINQDGPIYESPFVTGL